jgi:hypothetical protein
LTTSFDEKGCPALVQLKCRSTKRFDVAVHEEGKLILAAEISGQSMRIFIVGAVRGCTKLAGVAVVRSSPWIAGSPQAAVASKSRRRMPGRPDF